MDVDNNSVVLGGWRGGSDYKGFMDDVRFYDRSLTEDEINYIYNSVTIPSLENMRLPLNVFNNTDIYGEWKNNTYLDNGFLDSAYLDGRKISISSDQKYYGEWLLVKLDRKILLNKIIIDIGADGTIFTNFKIFGKNITQNDENLIVTSEIINTFFDNIIYTHLLEDNSYIINILENNYYNTILILFENIEENKNTLKIKNINFETTYKNWEI